MRMMGVIGTTGSTASNAPPPVAAAGAAAPARPSATGPGWKLYDETTATAAIVDAVRGAKTVVNAEFFGVSDAGKGAQLTDALVDAARRGVEVNVVTDFASVVSLPIGSFQRFRNRVEEAGGHVVVNSRLPFADRVREHPGLRHVDHRKVVTVDGTTGFTGGMNFVKITDDYHDSMVKLDGPAGARLAAEQLDRWSRVGGAVTDRHRSAVEHALDGVTKLPKDPREMAIVANAPEQGRFELTNRYLELIRGAKERLWITSPGFSDQLVIEELNKAAQRGVDVRVVAPGKAPLGVAVINWVGRSHLTELLGHGGKVFEVPEVLHRKAIIADDEVILSSYNITERSRRHDHELGVATRDPKFVAAMAQLLKKDMIESNRLEPGEFRGVGQRIGDFIAQRLRFSY